MTLNQIFQKKFDDLKKMPVHPIMNDKEAELVFDNHVYLFGDTFIKFTQISRRLLPDTLSSKKMFRLAFNSNEVNNVFTFELKDLDPDTIVNDPAYAGLRVTFYLEDIEEDFNSSELDQQIRGYKVIENSLAYRSKQNMNPLSTQINVFGDPDFDDRDEMMIVNKDNMEVSEMSGEEV